MKLTLFSYNQQNAHGILQSLLQQPRSILIEGRSSPYAPKDARFCRFGPHGLAHTWPDQYTFLTDEKDERGRDINWLGNANYKPKDRHKGVSFHNKEKGIPYVCGKLEQNIPCIIICGCTHNRCHLFTVESEIKKVLPLVSVEIHFPFQLVQQTLF